MRKRRAKTGRRPQPARGAAPLSNDLNAASRAQLGPDEEKRSCRRPQDDASIEDPLLDWQEDS